MPPRKVLAFTGCRSDYDLLSGLFRRLQSSELFDFKLIVSGAHLSTRHGRTVRMIESDNLSILDKIATIDQSEISQTRLHSAANLLRMSIPSVVRFNPDLIIFGGDREDVLVAATLGAYLAIPSAHFFGGDNSEDGHVDNLVRHSTSKLSTIHFVSTEEHAARLQAIGESADRIFKVGSPALDKFCEEPYKPLEPILNRLSIGNNDFAIVIYHPMHELSCSTGECFLNIVNALRSLGIFSLISTPNIDDGNEQIRSVLENIKNDPNFFVYHNLERTDFVNLFRNCRFLIGNSSMGIIEAPFVNVPSINVGLRQTGRKSAETVRFVGCDFNSVVESLNRIEDNRKARLSLRPSNLYGDGRSGEKAFQILCELDFGSFSSAKKDPLKI